VFWIVFSPQRHLREMPAPIEDEHAAQEHVGTQWGFGETHPVDESA